MIQRVTRAFGLIEGAVADPGSALIHTLFEQRAGERPHAIALVAGDTEVTYGELNQRADRFARRLRSEGLERGAVVALNLGRAVETIVAILGTLKAGAAYLPLERSYPDERLRFMVGDSLAQMLVTDRVQHERCRTWCPRVLVVDDPEPVDDRPDEEPASLNPDDLAYVMYTSGSTGTPKGVEVPHRAVARLVWGLRDVVLDANQRILQLAPLSFDASTFELWGALLRGGTCVLAPFSLPTATELERALRHHRITTLWLTSSLFNALIDEQPDCLLPVRQLLVGGEALSAPHIRRALQALPRTTIFNGYGPTEGTTFTCCYRIPRSLDPALQSIPIGRPLEGTEVHLLDARMQPVPVGTDGELFIGGNGLARGYRGQPALTAEAFVPNPFGPPGTRLYRSGDLVRSRADGTIEFVGRLDTQVKIRGYRIELAEIESALRRQPSIKDAAVVLDEPTPGDKRLVAYVVADGEHPADAGFREPRALRDALRRTLPDYMIPASFVVIDALPLTPNGKVDRAALPKAVAPVAKDAIHPSEAAEALLLIWRTVLGTSTLSIHDNFFDAGGHSLLAVKLMARIRAELNVELPLRELFTHPTVAELADCVVAEHSRTLRERRTQSPWTYLFELRPGGEIPVFFLPGGVGGDEEFLVYARLVHFADPKYRFYGFRPRSADGLQRAEAVAAIAADCLSEIRAVQTAGPYLIVGNCIGGMLAIEVARRLRESGDTVGALVLMDTRAPMPLATHGRVAGKQLLRRKREQFGYYRWRWTHHRDRMREMTWVERIRYGIDRLAAVTKPKPADVPGQMYDDNRRTYMRALQQHRPTAYRDPVQFIVSRGLASKNVVEQWSHLLTGRVDVLEAPGSHHEYIRTYAEATAKILDACLEPRT